MRQTAWLIVYPVMVDSHAFLFNWQLICFFVSLRYEWKNRRAHFRMAPAIQCARRFFSFRPQGNENNQQSILNVTWNCLQRWTFVFGLARRCSTCDFLNSGRISQNFFFFFFFFFFVFFFPLIVINLIVCVFTIMHRVRSPLCAPNF